jgi:hypothetical protein
MFRIRLAGSRTLVVVVAALAPCSALVATLLLQLLTTTLRATDTAATHAALCGTRMVLVWQVLATASLRQCLWPSRAHGPQPTAMQHTLTIVVRCTCTECRSPSLLAPVAMPLAGGLIAAGADKRVMLQKCQIQQQLQQGCLGCTDTELHRHVQLPSIHLANAIDLT